MKAIAERSGRSEPEVYFKWRGVGVGDRNITRLHRNKLLVRLEVVVLREYSRTNKLLLKDSHEIKQVLGMVVADVVDFVRRYRKSVLAIGTFRGMLHDAYHSLDNIFDIGEVPLAVAVVEDLDLLSLDKLVGESEIGHVGTPAGTVDGKEP